MGAELIIKDKRAVDGTVTEIVVWRLASPVPGCSHPFKYRFYFGLADGTSIVRYDNERGKGDHRHFGSKEEPYRFVSLIQLFRDFNADKDGWLSRRNV